MLICVVYILISLSYDTAPNPKPPVISTGQDYAMGMGGYGQIPGPAGMAAGPGRVGGAYTEFHHPATNVPQPYQQQHMVGVVSGQGLCEQTFLMERNVLSCLVDIA